MARADHGKLDGGFIYVMSNESMQGFYKVGQTTDLERRRLELSRSTGCPKPFVCQYAVYSKNYLNLEKIVHKKLEKYRIPGKEFFTCPYEVIIREIQKTCEEGLDSNKIELRDVELNVEHSVPEAPPKKLSKHKQFLKNCILEQEVMKKKRLNQVEKSAKQVSDAYKRNA